MNNTSKDDFEPMGQSKGRSPQALSDLNPNPNPIPPPRLDDITQEVRFAVVMYGGVSLAIYINGVTQELFQMVRATASREKMGIAADGKNLTGTQRVYRKLSYLLSSDTLMADYRKWLKDCSTGTKREQEQTGDPLEGAILQNNPISKRFIVDIISGTSAGGINGIYLAKALANDQTIDDLKKLWIEEGDIALLINDAKSVNGLNLSNQDPPKSLLNSRRMYLKLLRALDQMDEQKSVPQNENSPYVEDLDLFITTSDIEGMPLPLRLSDTVVYEKRHRNVIHLKYGTDEATGEFRNDFKSDCNPFLAFAARCTSSFPFAFEPMQLADIDEVLQGLPHYRKNKNCRAESSRWAPFFKEYVDPESGEMDSQYKNRCFGDGGYLDNKPFSYPTETLLRRHADVPVDRKLIYVEPSPEYLKEKQRKDSKDQRPLKPDALENIKAALFGLPLYETIREDLQKVLQRNRRIGRIRRLIDSIEKDIEQYQLYSEESARPQLEEGKWNRLGLAEMIEQYGPYYLPYRRLRVSALTDDIAKLIARVAQFHEDSDEFYAIRCLVRAWRELNYVDNRTVDQTEEKTVNAFLDEFDFNYRIRRLNFIRNRIDQIYRLVNKESKPDELTESERLLIDRLQKENLYLFDLSKDDKRRLQSCLSYLKRELNQIYRKLRTVGRGPQASCAPGEVLPKPCLGSNFREAITGLEISGRHLKYLLGMPWTEEPFSADSGLHRADQRISSPSVLEEVGVARAKELLEKPADFKLPTDFRQRFDRAARQLSHDLQKILGDTGEHAKQLLDPKKTFPAPDPQEAEFSDVNQVNREFLNAIREYLWNYYCNFDAYDQISFPILYDTDTGEADIVEVIRISPEDAPSLIDEKNERKTSKDGVGRRKLAGLEFHHFGAFLDRAWRQNDIMWGRLDGAERLITAMLPDPQDKDVRAELIREAHTAIILEELAPEGRRELMSLISETLVQVSSGEKTDKAVEKVMKQLKGAGPINTRLEAIMRNCFKSNEVLGFLSTDYEVNRGLDPKAMLRVLSRSTQVVGEMMEDIADAHHMRNKHLAWIARLGRLFGGLVELAVPQSFLNLLFGHWLLLLYGFEALLIVGAWLLGASDTLKFGWTALSITSIVTVTVLVLRDYMRSKNKLWRAFTVFVIITTLLFAGIGVDRVFNLGILDKVVSRITFSEPKER